MMPYIIILIGFVFLLYAISRFMKRSGSLKMNRLFQYGFALILGLLAFLILIRGNIAVGGILGLLSFLSVQGSLWKFLIGGSDKYNGRNQRNNIGVEGMSRKEALEILGLIGNPDKSEVREAHRKMMLKLHPDHGGSDYFAYKVNQARDTLL